MRRVVPVIFSLLYMSDCVSSSPGTQACVNRGTLLGINKVIVENSYAVPFRLHMYIVTHSVIQLDRAPRFQIFLKLCLRLTAELSSNRALSTSTSRTNDLATKLWRPHSSNRVHHLTIMWLTSFIKA